MPLNLPSHSIPASQYLMRGYGFGQNQLVVIGSNAYYVTLAQVDATFGGTNNLQIYKSSDGVTWTKVADRAPDPMPEQTVNYSAQFVVIGNTIYILGIVGDSTGSPLKVYLFFYRFDTVSDSFLSYTSRSIDQGGAGQQQQSISLMKNGTTILVSSLNAISGHLEFYTYDSVLDSWSPTTTVSADSSYPAAQITDGVSGLTFLFYRKSGTRSVRCAAITDGLLINDSLVVTFAGGPTPASPSVVGVPTLTDAEIVIPMLAYQAAGAPQLHAFRSPIQAAPAWTDQTVETYASLAPPATAIQQYDQQAAPGWIAFWYQGTLYVFYATDNGDLDSGASQCYLYYRAFESGIWQPSVNAYTSVVPGEMMPPFVVDFGGNPLAYFGIIDPTKWPNYSSLTNFTLYDAPIPPASKGTVYYEFSDNSGPVALPDPSVHCDINGQKRCLTVKDRRLIQRSKNIYGVR